MEDIDRNLVLVEIFNKENHTIVDIIEYATGSLIDDLFQDCSQAKSYVTQWNMNAEVLDNNQGDLVVIDLNFDGLEDLALIFESGGSSGPAYKYFIQTPEHKFSLDLFL